MRQEAKGNMGAGLVYLQPHKGNITLVTLTIPRLAADNMCWSFQAV